jgi:hypothetical protein
MLQSLGGGWDVPPQTQAQWHRSEELAPYRCRAALLAAALAAGSGDAAPRRAWGWKDPRCCLLLPLWLEMFPALKVVVIVRDPGSVAASLQRRGGYVTPAFGMDLWRRYHESLLPALQGRRYAVTHYDRLVGNPDGELQRICTYLGWEIPEEAVTAAARNVRGDLKHHSDGGEWRKTPLGRSLEPIYSFLYDQSLAVHENCAGI